jgi:hypothetical protein
LHFIIESGNGDDFFISFHESNHLKACDIF